MFWSNHSKNKPAQQSIYSQTFAAATQSFKPLVPKNMDMLKNASFSNGVLVLQIVDAKKTVYTITEQKTPPGITSDSFHGSRTIPTLYGDAKSTNLDGSTTVSLVSNQGTLLTLTSTPAAPNNQVDALLTSLVEP